MALTEEKVIDKIEVVGDYYHIQVREAYVIKRDGVEISKRYSRRVVNPGDDVSSDDQRIRNIANALHTADVITALQNNQKETEAIFNNL